ncbi:sensor histidine kinase [Ketobacter sp.]|uniref:sensor histidine kinase n=1 Tax=Ketobacter sp. TaxID=2083498 RepID=UPI000F1C88FF|nr:HAMP domain-containing sensor histidine kinase [Ketobacter sp.]RLU01272.1 MAG: sensor histidine kinase [Ketobacter sp.]
MYTNQFLNWGWDADATPPTQLRRVRSLVCACIAVILLVLPFIARAVQWGIPIRLFLLGSVLGLACASLLLLRRRLFALSLHSLALAIFLGGFNQYVTVGGLSSGAVTWWLIVALMSSLFGGLRAGLCWAVISLSIGLFLFTLEARGMVFDNLTPPEARNVQRVLIMVGEFLALGAVMVAYHTQIEGSERALKERNEQLQKQVQRAENAEAVALEAAAAKSRFLANMTHELRTPLNSILGFTKRVMGQLEGKIEPRQFDALKMVAGNGDQMLMLVGDLLDLSQLESDRMALSRGLIDLREMLNVLTPRLRLTAQRCNLDLELDAVPEAFIQGDVSQIKRVIETVVGHALQYCPSGAVRVRADVQEGQWCMQARCENLSFDEQHLERIFDRYHHLHSTCERPIVVSGLAMALARELAELHAGSLIVQNETGAGVCYRLTLPTQ